MMLWLYLQLASVNSDLCQACCAEGLHFSAFIITGVIGFEDGDAFEVIENDVGLSIRIIFTSEPIEVIFSTQDGDAVCKLVE